MNFNLETINWWAVIVPMVIAVGLSVMPWTRKHMVSPYMTVIHEYGHVVANVLTLGFPYGVKAHFGEGGGETNFLRSRGFFSGIGTVISGLSGYPAPILLGLTLIFSVPGGWSQVMIIVTTILFTLFIFLMRNLAGLLLALLTAGYFAIATFNPEYIEPMALTAGIVMVVGGVTDFLVLIGYWLRGIADGTDLGILQDRYFLPQIIWLLLMIAGTVGMVLLLIMVSFSSW